MKRKRSILALVMAAVLVGGCQWLIDIPTSDSAGHGPQVAVVGDSITILANPLIREQLEPNHELVANAIAGGRIMDVFPWLESHLNDSPIIIENLGTNDVSTNPNWQADLDTMLAALVDEPCVELVTINHPGYADSDTFNAELFAAATDHANVHVIDWAAVSGDPTFTLDGIHPSPAGRAWIATAYSTAIANDCAAETTTTTTVPDETTTTTTTTEQTTTTTTVP